MKNAMGGLLVGLGLLIAAAWVGRMPCEVLWSWPKVQAVATNCDIFVSKYESSGTGRGSYARYKAHVEFRYAVKGEEHVSWSQATSDTRDYKGLARWLTSNYASGTQHVIRYNPAHPADIRFDVGYNLHSLGLPLFLVLLGLVFVAAGFNGLRSARNKSTPPAALFIG